MFKLNLEEKLISQKEKQINGLKEGEALIEQANAILSEANEADLSLLKVYSFGTAIKSITDQKENLDRERTKAHLITTHKRLFSLDEIKKIAIQYRLRFLESERYTGILPPELPSKIRQAEIEIKRIGLSLNRQPVSRVMILAPANSFRLDPKDPLMFIRLNNGLFYLVHKWGSDLSALRRITMWPMQSTWHFSTVLIAIILFTILGFWMGYMVTIPFGFVGLVASLMTLITYDCEMKFSNEKWDQSRE